MVRDMHFQRKKPPKKRKKKAYAAVKAELDDVVRDINALRLALWYAEYKRDFHKLKPDEIKSQLGRINTRIEKISAHHLSDPDAL